MAHRGEYLMVAVKPCKPLLGQLSWLAEQSCSHRRVLALTQSIEAASGQTTERVLRLQKIRQALERGALVLYAQPIRDAQEKGMTRF